VRRLLSFAALFLPVLLLLVALYPKMLPFYKELGRRAANPFLSSVTRVQIESAADGSWDVVRHRRGGGEKTIFVIPSRALFMIYTSFLTLPALLLATPVAWPLRLRMLASGLLLLLAVQVLSHVVFIAVCARTLRTTPSSTVLEFLSVAHTTSAQLFPFAVWGMLTWRSWIPGDEPPARSGASL
jgi:hypothetical protein